MCGICGILDTRGQATDLARLSAMNDTLRHRGPDDAGTWRSDDRTAALAQRRLAVIDLSPAGHQPMHDPTGRLTLVYNGEVYNFQPLRAELEGLGHRFASHCDTEVILAAYRQWGEACLPRLNGMFAFALHDADRRTVLLARDRAGEKPLFVYRDGSRLLFASELKALMAWPDMPRRVCPDALNAYLTYGYVPGPMCMLQGVRKLPPGSALRFDLASGAEHAWHYWTLPQSAPPADGDAEALTDELDQRLAESVRQRLVADVPVGILLSGGLDSSLVTAMAARVGPRVRTFTVSFPGHGQFDEAPHARRIAEHFATDHTELVAEPASMDLLPVLARQYDEPMADSSMIPTYLVCRQIRQHATVALGGDGADELFGGYVHVSWLQRQQRLRRIVPGPLRRLAGGLGRRLPMGVRGRNQLIGLGLDGPASVAQVNVFFDPQTRRKLLSPLGLDSLAWDAPQRARAALCRPGADALAWSTEVDFQTYLVDDILAKVDRASMLTSLELRAPWLDAGLIEFAFARVPDALRAADGQRKVLLRRLAGRLLPSGTDLTRKQGFSLPLGDWFDGPWGPYVREVLAGSDLFDRPTVEALLAGQARGRNNTQRLYALMLLELWRREYRVSLPGRSPEPAAVFEENTA